MRLTIDIRAELAPYFPEAAEAEAKINIISPFRYEIHPSMLLDLRPDSEYFGCWHDSGASDPEWQSGGPVKLLAFLRNETYSETLDYLRVMYGEDADPYNEAMTLNMPHLSLKETYKPLIESFLDPYKFRHPYLGGRGITEPVQRLCNVGYDKRSKAVTIPLFNPDGTLGNVKYRKVGEKTFWYAAGGRPIREMLFGINVIYSRRIKRAAIVEAEIDAMTLMSAGIPAVATLGAHISQEKTEQIRRSPIEELILIRDNDKAGRKWQRQVIEALRQDISLSIVTVNRRYKDVNEAGIDNMKTYFTRERRIRNIKILL